MKRAALVLLVSTLACAPKSIDSTRTEEVTTPESTDKKPAACHVAPPAQQQALCSAAPASLGSMDPGTGFFKDVWATTGLSTAIGRRVVFADVNGDKFPDILNLETGSVRGTQHLWISAPGSNGGRTFSDQIGNSGLTINRDGGVGQTTLLYTVADVDNDGDLDVYSGGYSQESDPSSTKYSADPSELYLNDGTGKFTRKEGSGLSDLWPRTPSSAVFFDYDGDGKLDLFVGHFMKNYPNLDSYQSELYRGLGDGRFELATNKAGLTTPYPVASTSGLFAKPVYGVTTCDYDDDGDQDLLVSAYSLMPDDLWRNDNGVFVNVSAATKFDQDDQSHPTEEWYRQGGNSFSHICGDYDNDGDLDVFSSETTHGDYPRNAGDRSRILVNGGPGKGYVFERPTLASTGINRPLGALDNEGDHGASWIDFDNDGLLDLVIEQSAYPGNHAWLYRQKPDHTFVDVTTASGVAASMVASNGLTVDDFDRDGDLDILMGSVHNINGVSAPEGREQLHLYENQFGRLQNWLYVTLKGVAANKQGIGARITVTAGCLTQTREISGGKGTFGAQNPAYAHFGLGQVDRIDRLEITWPTSPPHREVFENVAVNQFLEITEGSQELSCTGPAR